MKGKTKEEGKIEFRQMVMPNNTNSLGTLFGGTMMSWLDQACAMCAQKHSNKAVVTVHMDDISFKHPLQLGDQVLIKAQVSYVGKTSIEVEAKAYQDNPIKNEFNLCVTAFMTFVALDSSGKKTSVAPLIATTEEDKALIEAAKQRVSKRLKLP